MCGGYRLTARSATCGIALASMKIHGGSRAGTIAHTQHTYTQKHGQNPE